MLRRTRNLAGVYAPRPENVSVSLHLGGPEISAGASALRTENLSGSMRLSGPEMPR